MFWGKNHEIITDDAAIDRALTRGVSEVLPNKDALKKLLKSGERITLYQGFDPTGTELHIGHMVGLRKLREFQKLGHRVIFLVGDGTGQAGDPSGKTAARAEYPSTEGLRKNAQNYKEQAGKILSFDGKNGAEMLFNSAWLNTLTLPKILEIAGSLTLQQLSERSIFQERVSRGEAVNLREFLYPLLQGYDSVAMGVDLEIGATDQTFNMLVGRVLVKKYLKKEKFVLTTPLLTDASGAKIGKSEGNVISLTDKPENLYGKILRLPDSLIIDGLLWLTDVEDAEITKIEKDMETGENPKIFKKRLALDIVRQIHGPTLASGAQKYFEDVIEENKTPQSTPTFTFSKGARIDVLLQMTGMAGSASIAKRLIEEGAVINLTTNKKITNPKTTIDQEITIRVGKHRFIRFVLKE